MTGDDYANDGCTLENQCQNPHCICPIRLRHWWSPYLVSLIIYVSAILWNTFEIFHLAYVVIYSERITSAFYALTLQGEEIYCSNKGISLGNGMKWKRKNS